MLVWSMHAQICPPVPAYFFVRVHTRAWLTSGLKPPEAWYALKNLNRPSEV